MKWRRLIAAALMVVTLFSVTGCMIPYAESSTMPAASGLCTGSTTGDATKVAGVTPAMAANAKIIADYALANGFGQPGVLVGITSAWTESTLNEKAVDPSNRWVGLFQMSAAWVAGGQDRTDPHVMTEMFYQGSPYGHPGLADIEGWQDMEPGRAAATVEGNLGRVAQYIGNQGIGQQITDALAGTETCTTGGAAGAAAGNASALQQNSSQDPSSFGWKHNGPMEPLVYQGHSFGQVAKGTAPLWIGMLNDLVPRIPGGLNAYLGCYEDRSNVNSPGRLSFHAYGLACDLNYDKNPNGAAPTSLTGQYVIPISAAKEVATKWGMEWGGNWGYPDAMHFEIHLTPAQVAQVIAGG